MYSEYTLESLCSDLRRGTVSAADIRQAALSAETQQSHLNCFIRHGNAEEQFEKAKDVQKGAPLYGIPVSFKDNICVAGLPVTAGTQGMADCIATHDAVIVRKLKSLGAVVAGKNNMNELCFGVTSSDPYWGMVENPSAPGYCIGGSSSGCAAAVAAGIVAGGNRNGYWRFRKNTGLFLRHYRFQAHQRALVIVRHYPCFPHKRFPRPDDPHGK
ncbi:amidase family protein [Dickeya dadantii subsp. dieffenbachiae]|uniref:amidase family protein n=1 Tax=Dickeya dadantii TaxID=204038 RepID=UPI000AE859CA